MGVYFFQQSLQGTFYQKLHQIQTFSKKDKLQYWEEWRRLNKDDSNTIVDSGENKAEKQTIR